MVKGEIIQIIIPPSGEGPKQWTSSETGEQCSDGLVLSFVCQPGKERNPTADLMMGVV